MKLTEQQAKFLLDCIRYSDLGYPRVDPRMFETIAPDLVRSLQEIAGGG